MEKTPLRKTIAPLRPIPILHICGYDKGFVEAVVQNNHFHGAVQLMTYGAQVEAIKNNYDKPLVFYHWEPALLLEDLRPRRIFLPAGPCAEESSSRELTSWKCDWPAENLFKMASSNLKTEAPLAWKLVQAFQIKDASILSAGTLKGAGMKVLLRKLSEEMKANPNATMETLTDDLACEWARANEREGAVWYDWAHRNVPNYAHVVGVDTIGMRVLAVTLTIIVLTFLVETFLVRSSIFVGLHRLVCDRGELNSITNKQD